MLNQQCLLTRLKTSRRSIFTPLESFLCVIAYVRRKLFGVPRKSFVIVHRLFSFRLWRRSVAALKSLTGGPLAFWVSHSAERSAYVLRLVSYDLRSFML